MSLAIHAQELFSLASIKAKRERQLNLHMLALGHCSISFESSNSVIVACDEENTAFELTYRLNKDGYHPAIWPGRMSNLVYVRISY